MRVILVGLCAMPSIHQYHRTEKSPDSGVKETSRGITTGCPIFLADGEGFEPPVELPPQRFSRPSQSTALPPIQNLFRRSFKPTVLFTVRTWRCCSPLVRARQRYACLADSYARPSQSTALPPIQNRCWQSQNASDILSYRFGMPACQLQTALVFYIYFL